MKRNDVIKFLILRTIGNFLVLFALFGVGATFGPTLYYEVQFRWQQAKGVTYKVVDQQSGSSFGDLLSNSKEQLLIPKDTFFDVLIPKIGANARVFPNVDPANETEYVATLKKGVAHAKGSVFPGMNGSVYLFAHSTDSVWDVGRYNAIFYLLKDLGKGDDVVMFFQDKRYNYKVVDTKIVEGNDVSYLTNAQSLNKQQLVLQTCWPPGTTWKRLLVFAEPHSQ